MSANEEASPTKPKLYSEEEVKKLLSSENYKKFCKKKCGQCNAAAFKKYTKMSPLVVRAQIGSFWCKECGRLLCEAHRNQHTCEKEDAEERRTARGLRLAVDVRFLSVYLDFR